MEPERRNLPPAQTSCQDKNIANCPAARRAIDFVSHASPNDWASYSSLRTVEKQWADAFKTSNRGPTGQAATASLMRQGLPKLATTFLGRWLQQLSWRR